ncbi:MAG: hypothetical protein ABSC51_01150 [Gaiellaceae bacterium]|jgi:hypothetical protein
MRVNAIYNARLVFTLDLDKGTIESVSIRSLTHYTTGLAIEPTASDDWEEIHERAKQIVEGDPITIHWNGKG